jgi:hypothetical protein
LAPLWLQSSMPTVNSRAVFIQRPRFLSKSGWTISIQ